FVWKREFWGGARCGEEVPPLRFAAVGTTGGATTFDSLVIGRQPENDVGQRPGRRWRISEKDDVCLEAGVLGRHSLRRGGPSTPRRCGRDDGRSNHVRLARDRATDRERRRPTTRPLMARIAEGDDVCLEAGVLG